MTDIYPIVFYDRTVEPATNVAKAVLTGTANTTAANNNDDTEPTYPLTDPPPPDKLDYPEPENQFLQFLHQPSCHTTI